MRILPISYTLSPHLLNIHPQPFTSGGFADVYHGTFDGLRVCIKRFRVHVQEIQDNPEKALKVRYRLCCLPRLHCSWKSQNFCREAVVWKHMVHPNVVPLLGVAISQQLQLISDWMPGGDLLKYIKKNPDANRHGLVGIPLVGSIARSPPSSALRRC